MTQKLAYLSGPISSFSGSLVKLLAHRDWQVHIAVKSALDLFTMSPLELPSSAQAGLEQAFGGREALKTFQDRIRLITRGDAARNTKYDAVIFCGLPPNFDEPRVPRAPWTADDLRQLAGIIADSRLFIVSSIWGAVQPDNVIPEELECERRKPQSHWEGVCQQYELRLLKQLGHLKLPWNLVRLPQLTASSQDGSCVSFSGIMNLPAEADRLRRQESPALTLALAYNPDSTVPFLPVDTAVNLFWRLLDDEARPRILNLVSPEATLNREWVEHLAAALGYNSTAVTKEDSLSLPAVLRKMLRDEIMIRTRNLFEVVGRHHFVAKRMDREYFGRLVAYGRKMQWGRPEKRRLKVKELSFSDELAHDYFERFLPSRLQGDLLQVATKDDTTVGFVIEGEKPVAFAFRNDNGRARVDRRDPQGVAGEIARVRIYLSPEAMLDLVRNRLSLDRAMLFKSVRMEGPILDLMRVERVLNRFFKENQYRPDSQGEVDEESARSPLPPVAKPGRRRPSG